MSASLKKNWDRVAAVTAWVLAIVLNLVPAPPVVGGLDVSQFARFGATLIVGLLLIATFRYRDPKHLKWWVLATVTGVVLSVFLYVWNVQLQYTHIVAWDGRNWVAGDDFLPQAQEYCETEFGVPCGSVDAARLIEDYAGRYEWIWTADSIQSVRRRLVLGYVCGVPAFAATVICLCQSLYCQARRPRKKRNPPAS